MSELIFRDGNAIVFRAPLNTRALRVGHSALNDIVLPGDGVAPFQASVERTPDGFVLLDRSGNGTPVNGKNVAQAALSDGDRIALGRLTQTGMTPS